MYVNISIRHLKMISDALATKIRLLESYVNRTDAMILEGQSYKDLKERIDDLLLNE